MSHPHLLLGRCITLAYLSCSSITPVRVHQKLSFGDFPPFLSRQTQQLTYHTHQQLIYHTNHKSGIGITSNPDHPPLSRHCVGGHVLRAVALPIAIVAVVAHSPPSFCVVPVGFHCPLCCRHHRAFTAMVASVAAWRRRRQLGGSKGGRAAVAPAPWQR